jgi:hypothetical protein
MRVVIAALILAAAAHSQSGGDNILTASPAILDRVAVVVGNKVITESEVVQQARIEAFLNGASVELGPESRRAAAERLVDQQLIRTEMRIGDYPAPSAKEIDEMLQNLKKERWASETEYRGALERYGITEAELRGQLAWQLAVIRFTDMRFGGMLTDGANRSNAAGADLDAKLEAWLKETRATTKIRFKPEAFQ